MIIAMATYCWIQISLKYFMRISLRTQVFLMMHIINGIWRIGIRERGGRKGVGEREKRGSF